MTLSTLHRMSHTWRTVAESSQCRLTGIQKYISHLERPCLVCKEDNKSYLLRRENSLKKRMNYFWSTHVQYLIGSHLDIKVPVDIYWLCLDTAHQLGPRQCCCSSGIGHKFGTPCSQWCICSIAYWTQSIQDRTSPCTDTLVLLGQAMDFYMRHTSSGPAQSTKRS